MFNKKSTSKAALSMGASETGNQYGGASYKTTFDISKVGDGKLEKYSVRKGENRIDVIPFNAGPNHPLVATGQCAEGDVMYSLDYFVHKSIGGSNDFLCLKQYGQRCPCCDENLRLWKSATNDDEKKVATALRAKRRCIYIVHDLLDGKYYYMDQAWYSFEQYVNKRAQITQDPATGTTVNPFDWEVGKTITFHGEEDTWEGHKYNKISESSFGFVDRAPLSDEVLNHSVDLSAGIIFCTEEDMDNALCGKPVVSQKPAQPTQTQSSSAQTQPTQTQTSSLASQALSAAQAPTPQPTQTPPAQTQSAPAQSFDNMQPVQTQQPQPTQAAPTDSEKVCPCGHEWGDANHTPDYPECATCPLWEKCIDG